jgi:hypothetical protein
MPAKPLARNSAPAASMMRWQFSAAFSRLTLMLQPGHARRTVDKLYDAHHQYARMMMIII